ncbi:MAG: LamG-like jellyroll fold domain-containing protein [Verrucomicrobiota bacterium]|nr:LamG-like jellyroll fold domain-containing protein [Verrucomicrobiota bacterium]
MKYLLAGLLYAFSGLLYADSYLNLDLTGHLNPFVHSKTGMAAVGAGSNDFWNVYSRDISANEWRSTGVVSNLLWHDQTPAQVTALVTNAAGLWLTDHPDAMFESYLYPSNKIGSIGLTFSGLPSGEYDVYVYAHGQVPGENSVISLYAAGGLIGTNSTSTSTNWNDTNNWVEGSHYVAFRGIALTNTGELHINSAPGLDGVSVLNGVQLVYRALPGVTNPPVEPPINLVVADWTFEEGGNGQIATNLVDYSGRGHSGISFGGLTYVSSEQGSNAAVSLAFEGVGGFMPQASSDFNFSTNDFTIEVIVLPGAGNLGYQRGVVVAQNPLNGNIGYAIGYDGLEGRVTFYLQNASGTQQFVRGNLPTNSFSHVAAVRNGNQIELYVNGSLVASNAVTIVPNLPVTGGPVELRVGASSAGYNFNGTLDRVRMTKKALNPSEFAFVSPPPPSQTVADWTFEEGVLGQTVTNVVDYSGQGNHGSPNGVLGYGKYISGTNESISMAFPSSALFKPVATSNFNFRAESFTLEALINPGDLNTEQRGLVVAQNPSNNKIGYALGYSSQTREVTFYLQDESNVQEYVRVAIPSDNFAHHIAAVRDDNTLKLYLDGNLAASNTVTILPGLPPGGPVDLYVGGSSAGYYYHGSMDRVRITRGVLGPQEFFPFTPGTTSIDPPIITLQPISRTVNVGGNATFTVAGMGQNLVYQWFFGTELLTGATNSSLVLSNIQSSAAGGYSVVLANELGSVVSRTALLTVLDYSGLLGDWTMEEGTNNVTAISLRDYSSFSNNATSTPSRRTAVYTNVVEGEGSLAVYFKTNRNSLFSASGGEEYRITTNFTAEAILNPSGTNRNETFFLIRSSIGTSEFRLSYDSITQAVAIKIVAFANSFTLTGPLPQDGKYHYIGVIINESGVALFVDKQLVGFKPLLTPIIFSGVPSYIASIGGDINRPTGFTGSIDRIRLFGSGFTNGFLPFPSLPVINSHPVSQIVWEGQTVELSVGYTPRPGISVQWYKGTNSLPNQTNDLLTLPGVSLADSGTYKARLSFATGEFVDSSEALLTVLPADDSAPVIVIDSPLAGETVDERFHLRGSIQDNSRIVNSTWSWNGAPPQPLILQTSLFEVLDQRMVPGTNIFTIIAEDEFGNFGSNEVTTIWTPLRVLSLGSAPARQEGAAVQLPIRLTSTGVVSGITFIIAYDTNYLRMPVVEWNYQLDHSLKEVNDLGNGKVKLAVVGALDSELLGSIRFRTRSVPSNLVTSIDLELVGIYDQTGNELLFGTALVGSSVNITQRDYLGDNNANDRLDVGDAGIILRMVTELEEVRPWDVTGNDLNINNQVDSGDVIRVLRAVVGLDPQPGSGENNALARQNLSPTNVPLVLDYVDLTTSNEIVSAGDIVTVTGDVYVESPISGASFKISYPADVLRLTGSQSLGAGTLVPSGGLVLWNVAPANNYSAQSGLVSGAMSTPTLWNGAAGQLLRLSFVAQEGITSKYRWPIEIQQVEVSDATSLTRTIGGDTLYISSRTPIPANIDATISTEGKPTFTITGEAGGTYRIEVSTNLVDWTTLYTQTTASGQLTITDLDAGEDDARFYRAVQVE